VLPPFSLRDHAHVTSSFFLVSLLGSARSVHVNVNVTRACVSAHPSNTDTLRLATKLIDDVNRRLPTVAHWHISSDIDCGNSARTDIHVALAVVAKGADEGLRLIEPSCAPDESLRRGGFLIQSHDAASIDVRAADLAGLGSAVGRLLRELRLPPKNGHPPLGTVAERGGVSFPSPLCVHFDPAEHARWSVRSHHITCSNHPYQFRTVEELGVYASELWTFGTTGTLCLYGDLFRTSML